MFAFFSGGYMKAWLSVLIFHPEFPFLAHCLKHFAEDSFQVVDTAGIISIVGNEGGVGNVERRAELMDRGVDCVAVATAQEFDSAGSAQKACHLYTVVTT